jgi:outer membrane protein assembly factor BamB
MKTLKNRIAAIAIAIFLTISIGASMILVPTASAHDPPWEIPTFSFCSVSPNPVGVGQTLRVNFWVNEPPPTAQPQQLVGNYGDRWENMTVIVTKPDGTTETLGPYKSDCTGGTVTTYTPKVVGNYTFQMIFPGQILAGNNLWPGISAMNKAFVGDYYQPSKSNVDTVTVQEEPISYPPATPLPTKYWTRPINALNNNWYVIGGNWLGFYQNFLTNTGGYGGSMNYNPYTTAPTTAHILWTKPEYFGGQVGGEFGGSQAGNYYSAATLGLFAPIIINGILYYTEYPMSTNSPTGWAAVNLKTGQTVWTMNTPLTAPAGPISYSTPTAGPCTILRCGQILNYVTAQQYGSTAWLWSTGTPAMVASATNIAPYTTTYNLFDAKTGTYTLSIVNGSAMTLTEDANGNLIGYYVGGYPTAPTLNCWNSTQAMVNFVNAVGGWRITPIFAPPQGAIIPFSYGIMWSVPLPTSFNGVPLPQGEASYTSGLQIKGVASGVVLLLAPAYAGGAIFQGGFIIEAGYSSDTGEQLWITNRTETPYTIVETSGVGEGVWAELEQSTLTLSVYSLTSGQQLWTTPLPNTKALDTLATDYIIANGTIYAWAYGGDVWAYNIATGALEWQYSTPSGGFESPYAYKNLYATVTQTGTVAGGMLFLSEGHAYGPPLWHGAEQFALNITNGQLVWSITDFTVTNVPAIADGVMVTMNNYDNQIYAFGIGPSATTVTAPDVGVTTATPVTITGNVMDISAGSQQEAVAANFPNGLPCVSDASMTQWMEYIYEQQPLPTDATGVEVVLDVIDSNGNYYNIGTATTDTSGTFAFTWTPIIPGEFTVIATFAGTNSYYGSRAEAHFYTSEVPAPTPAPTPTPASIADLYLMPMSVGIIVAIAVVGAVIVLMLRKR